MAQNNKINFQLDFKKGDTAALDSLKKDLQEIQRLASDYSFSGGNATEMNKMITAAKTVERALTQAFDPNLNTVNIQKFNNILKQSGYNAQTLQADLANAGAVGQQAFLKMTGQLMQFNTATKQTNKFLDDIATSFFNTVKWGIMSSIINNISGTIQKSYYYVKDLDTGLNDIRIVTGKSADEMARFAEQANEAAKSLAVTTDDYTQGSLIYYQQGLDDETVKQLTDITAKTSNVTGQSMETVSEQLTAVWNGYKVANQAAEEGMQVYEEYVDKMAAVGATTASDLQELSTAMSKVASAANSMGVDFDDLNAQIATIVSVTRQAPESVGTALKTIYARLGDLKVDGVDEFGVKLGEVTANLQTMGINILDQNGNMRDMSIVMAEVAKKWDTWTEAQRQAAAVAMAGKRQYNNLVALFDNWDMYGKALETSLNAAGTLEEQQAIAMDSLANKMDVLKSTAEDLYDSLFNTDTISDFIEAGTGVLQFFADFTDAVGGLNNILPMLGSLALQIFNEQIGKGLSTIVINARNTSNEIQMLKNNFEQIKLMYSDAKIFNVDSTSNGEVTARLKEIEDYYTKMYQYQSLMNQEQKEEYKLILNKKIELGNTTASLGEELKHWQIINNEFQLLDENLINNVEKFNELNNQASNLKEVSKTLNQVFNSTFNWKEYDVEHGLGFLKADFEEILNNAVLLDQITEEQFTSLNNRVGKLDSFSAVKNEILKIIEEMHELGASSEEINKMRAKIDQLSGSINILDNALTETLSIEKLMTDMTSLVGVVGQLASAVNTFQNLEKVWSNENLTDAQKMTQTVMNLSFVFTGFISTLKTLRGTAFGDFIVKQLEAVSAARNASRASIIANQLAMNSETAAIVANITAEEAKEIAEGKVTLAEKIEQKARENNIDITKVDTEVIRKNTKAKLENAKASDAQAAAERSQQVLTNTGEMIASSIGTAGVVGIIIGILALITTALLKFKNEELDRIEELRKAREEEINSIEEERQAKIKEIEVNQELTQSYIDLYAQYEQGIIGKEKLEEASDSVVEILGKENVAVAKLTGNYELLNQQLKEAREKELNTKIETNQYAKNEALQGAKNVNFNMALDENALPYYSEKYSNLDDNYKKYFNFSSVTHQYDDKGKYNPSTTGQITTNKNVENFDIHEYLLAAEELFGIQNQQVGELARYAFSYYNSENEEFFAQLEKDLSQSDLESLSTYGEYSQVLNDTISKLQNVDGYKDYNAAFDKAIEIISRLSGNNDDFETRAIAEKQLLDKYSGKENATNLLKDLMSKLSDEDLGLLLQGKVQISEQDTIESVRQTLDLAEKRFGEEDLSIAVSLRTKLTSDKNLTQKQVKEMQEELGALGAEYDQLFDFANKSELEKLDIVNSIVEEQIKVNEELASGGIEVMKEQMEEYEAAQKRLNELHEKAKYGGGLTEEETKEWEQLSEQIETTTDDYKIWQGTVENFDYGNNAFNDLLAGLDGVISKAKLLKDLAEDVGEGWVIAAEDVERFGKNFPEIVADSENYNVTQEKGFELTKQGQELYAQMLAQKKEELIAQNESYKLELQQQADARMATAEYYRAQAQHLKDYLEGKATAAETENKLNQEVSTYAGRLAEITGENEEELHRTIQENYNATTGKATEETGKIYDDWVGVGKVAEAASVAYENKVFEDPGLRPSGGASTGTNTTKYRQLHKEGDYAYTTSFTDEEIAKIEAQIKSLNDAATIQEDMASTEYSKIAALDAEMNAALEAMDNAAAGKGGKGSKSSSKDKKDKEKKLLEDEFDRYFDIKKAIEEVDHAVSILEKDQKNLHGKELISSLKKENELIKEQTENYQKLYEAQQEEAKELGAILRGKGLEFTEDGAISNYAEATTAALAKYNKAVDAYNAGALDDAGFEIAEKSYERFKKQLERYEELYYKEMQDTFDKIDDNNRKVLENNLKAWETEIQVQLDLNEAERNWSKFFKEINTDFKKVFKDLGAEMSAIAKEASTYQSDIAVDIKAINDTMAEIDKLNADQATDHTQAISEAQEKLKELNDQLMDHAKSLRDAYENAWDAYLEGIDQAAEKFDKLNDQFDRVNDQLEFQGELIELMYGEKAYDLMDKLYEGQEHASRNQIQSVQEQLDFWKKLYEETSEGDKDHEKALEKMNELQDKLNDLTLDYIKTLKSEYSNTIDKILDDLDKKLTGGKGSNWLNEEWERVSNFSDTYFDGLEKAYHIQTLSNKIEKDISKTYQDNVKAQQKLAKFRDVEIKKLKDIKNLRQEDLDIAQAKYDLTLKEIALEESRNNKNAMKLVRNEQGNWSYQYVADEEEEENSKQDKLDSNYNLYETANSAYNAIINEQLKAVSDYGNQMKTLQMDETIGEEEKNSRMAALRDSFLEESEIRQEKANDYFNEMKIAGTALGIELYQQDETAFSDMLDSELEYLNNFINTEKIDYLSLEEAFQTNCADMDMLSKTLMENTRFDWSQSAEMLEALWNGDEESVRSAVETAYSAMQTATEEYGTKIEELEELVRMKFYGKEGEENIVNSIKMAEDETDVLKGKTKTLVIESGKMLEDLRTDLNNTTKEWINMRKSIVDAINALAKYLTMQGKAVKLDAPSVSIDTTAEDKQEVASSASEGKDYTQDDDEGGGTPNLTKPIANPRNYTVQSDPNGVSNTIGLYYKGSLKKVTDEDNSRNEIEQYLKNVGMTDKNIEFLREKMNNSDTYVGFRTGGYTGEWNGDNGKLAVLHKKEMVLNEDDTENLLNTVAIMRNLKDKVLENALQLAEVNYKMLMSGYNTGASSENTNTGTTFYIDRLEFPNANSVDEIKMAIMSLPNVASQYVNRNVK